MSSNRKGKRLKFLYEDWARKGPSLGYINGNVKEKRDGRVSRDPSYLLGLKEERRVFRSLGAGEIKSS